MLREFFGNAIHNLVYEIIKKMPYKQGILGTIQYPVLLVKLFPYSHSYTF